MSDDIVDRLQSHMGKAEVPDLLRDCREAAAEITRLREDVRAAGAVKVRALEWQEHEHDIHSANAPGGGYTVCRTGIRITWCRHDSGGWIEAADLAAAKAAAQADYEQRVLSALVTAAPSPPTEKHNAG